jgi:hypothetical protein
MTDAGVDKALGSSGPSDRTRRRARALRILALVVVALALSAYAWWPALFAYPDTQAGDGPQYHKMLEAAKYSILRYHELPLWNPYECGGLPLWDNPQAFVGAPLSWLTFLVGTTRSMELWYVVHSAIGFLCMWVFARGELRLSRAATFVASAVWAFNGFHQQHYSGGHTTFVPFEYFPLALLLWRRAEGNVRYAVGLGVLVAWMLYEGAVYPVPHLAILLAAEALTRAWPPKRLLFIARAGAIVGVLAFVLSAGRLLPVIHQLRSHTRGLNIEHDAMQWSSLKDMFLARSHGRPAPGQDYVWPEFGAYIGPILLTFAIVGLFVSGLENLWLVVLLALVFSLMCGHFSPYAPWHILKGHIFPFKEMRVPSRFRCEVTLFLALFVGLAIDRVPKLARRLGRPSVAGFVRVGMLAASTLAIGDMMGIGIDWFTHRFDAAPAAAVVPSTRLYFGGPGLAQFIDEPHQNRGRLQCWDEWGFGAGAPLWEGDVPQARSNDPQIVVQVANRTQNTFTLDVGAAHAGRVLLNSTFDLGWRTDVGTLSEENKELVLDVPAGEHHVKIEYWPHGLTAGIVINTLGLIGLVGLVVWDRRRRARLSGPPTTSG